MSNRRQISSPRFVDELTADEFVKFTAFVVLYCKRGVRFKDAVRKAREIFGLKA